MRWKRLIAGLFMFATGVYAGIWAAAQYGLAETRYEFVVEDSRGEEITRHTLDDGNDDGSGEIPIE